MPHTPGPWEFGKVKPIVGVSTVQGWFIGPSGRRPAGEGFDIAEVYLSSSQNAETQEANARLMTAAPDLLEALITLEKWAAGQGSRSGGSRGKLCQIAQAAISKAKGDEPQSKAITILGRACHFVPTGRDTFEIVANDEGELTEAEWAEYCRMIRKQLKAKGGRHGTA